MIVKLIVWFLCVYRSPDVIMLIEQPNLEVEFCNPYSCMFNWIVTAALYYIINML